MESEKESVRGRCSRFLKRRIPLPIYLIIVLLFLFVSAGMMTHLEQINPSGKLFGIYRSLPTSAVYYNARFFHNEFKIERLSQKDPNQKELVLEGRYEHLRENLYLLKPEDPSKNMIVVLGKRNFYFYDSKTDSIPRFY